MIKHQQININSLARLERRSTRPATAPVDIILMTAVFFALAYGVVYCLTHGLVELGTVATATIVWFLYRVVIWDANRVTEESVREYYRPTPEPPLRQPVVISQNGGGYVAKYGQLHLNQDEYRQLLDNLQRHPRKRLTRAAVDGFMTNASERYAAFYKEMQRLKWINSVLILTPAGHAALHRLAHDPPTDSI